LTDKKTGKTDRSKIEKGTSTKSVHEGEIHGSFDDSVTTPVFLTSTYVFKNTKDIKEFTSGRNKRFEYGRYGNPTQQVAEKKLAGIEGAESCLLFDSGMSAITATLLTYLEKGKHVITTDDAYKKTHIFCEEWLPRFGIESTIVEMGDDKAMEAAVREETAVIITESPTNPYLNIADFGSLGRIKKKHPGITIIVDSTFGTPYNQKPLEYGVDIVIHSVTKYLGGHNDLMGGAVLASSEQIEKVSVTQQTMGGIMDPHTCYLLIRGLKTFALRMERQNSSGMKLAKFLESHGKVSKVYYPGLKSHRYNSVARKQMKGYGGVVTFEIDSTLAGVNRFLNNLRVCQIGPSLGGTETLVSHPASVSYYDYSRKERYALGITDGLIRLAVGVEDAEDIINDLDMALAGV